MKICKIYIRDFHQFQDIVLDFTDPITGHPVEKVCFIGRNGTGKSKILRLINWFFFPALDNAASSKPLSLVERDSQSAKIVFKFLHKGEYFLFYFFGVKGYILRSPENAKIEEELIGKLLELTEFDAVYMKPGFKEWSIGVLNPEFIKNLILQKNSSDLLIFSPAETSSNLYINISDVPKTTVSDALGLSDSSYFAEVSQDKISIFWKLLVYNLKKRDEEREVFERNEINVNKTKAALIKEFDELNPKVLDNLAKIWDRILSKAGLEFDVDGASNPIQLTDNLKAYVRLKKSKKVIPYSGLSTGIRNFIFRIGHIYSLYFNRKIDRGFVLIDEPENSLYPDFLFDLVEIYQQIVIDKRGQNNTQMFFASHNPIIAAQFEPYERIILDWDEDGFVTARKGVSPVGDDPNDVLTNDFELTDLMGPEGRKQWEKYVQLKKTLTKATDKSEKMKLVKEINHIGQQYNFPE